MFNILTEKLIHTDNQRYTLPGVFAALARDEIDSFSALRPHQEPAWYMFLVQLAAMALRHDEAENIFEDEESWLKAIRKLAPKFPADEPWHLVVDDWSSPAFLQPPVHDPNALKNHVPTPDYLDVLITSKNHDIKQTLIRNGKPEDWLFALVSLQTTEGYSGQNNQSISRMNGGAASRSMVTLAPISGSTFAVPRLGQRFRRDIQVLLNTYENEFNECNLYSRNGICLTWVEPWLEDEQLQIGDLDIWFIEVCRRIRLKNSNTGIYGYKGLSKKTRINAKNLNGSLRDPFAPVHKTKNHSLTISSKGFNYSKLVEILFSGEWQLPVLARPSNIDHKNSQMCLITSSIVRGNCKTEGFSHRVIPINGRNIISLTENRENINKIAKEQCENVNHFNKAIGNGLSLAAAGGNNENRKESHYKHAHEAQQHFEQGVDRIFFKYLWEIADAKEDEIEDVKLRWLKILYNSAQTLFEANLPSIPCSSSFRPRAEFMARRAFIGSIRKNYPELFEKKEKE